MKFSLNKFIIISSLLSIILLLSSTIYKINFLYYFSYILISISFILISINYFFIAYFLDCIILIITPSILSYYNQYFFYDNITTNTVIFICWLLIISIINFFILAYNIKNKPSVEKILFLKKFHLHNFFIKYNTIMRIIVIFTLYLVILYSVLNSFGVLYNNLSKMFNEGIEGERRITSYLDALYFSTTTFFTIGFGDITPSDYSEITKKLVIIQAILGHILTTVLWPIVIIFIFSNKKKLNQLISPYYNK